MLTWFLVVGMSWPCAGAQVNVMPNGDSSYYCAEIVEETCENVEDALVDFCDQNPSSSGGSVFYQSIHPFSCPSGMINWGAEG